MLVEEMMVSPVITLTKDDTIEEAALLIKSKHIRHIPIVDHLMNCIGIVTDRDIRSAIPSKTLGLDHSSIVKRTVETIMTKNVITAHPLDFVEEVARLFYTRQIGCLPVVKSNRLVGIITQTDVLRTFVTLTGTDLPGSQIEIRVKNKAGELSNLILSINQHKLNIHSVLIYPDPTDEQYKIIVLRVNTINPNMVLETIQANGFEIVWPNFRGIKYE